MADLLQYLISSSPTHNTSSLKPSRSSTDSMQEAEIFSTPRESPQRAMEAGELPSSSLAAAAPGPVPSLGIGPNGNVMTTNDSDLGVVEDELPITDIDDPRMQALLNSVPLPRKVVAQAHPLTKAATASKTPQSPTNTPVQIGKTHSAAHVIEFYKLCQERGLAPEFIFTGAADRAEFAVRVEFGEYNLVEAGPFASKKEAKEVAAEKGVRVLRDVPIPEKLVKEGEKGQNWVGMLSEYCSVENIPQPSFTDYAVGLQFACETTIDKRPDEPFGGRDNAFPSKKAAKANAAREAVLWLQGNGHMSEAGPMKKKQKIGGAILADGPGAISRITKKETMSNAQKVNGLNSPEYRFSQSHPGFHSGAAYFPRDPEIQGPVGEIRQIHGIKNAKDECAKLVLVYLQDIVKARGGKLEDIL
ncbi:MAG: hypothetical protein M1812_003615 [Candelaria pacifica]|nr:MAG: hypothetical protein M1812_003615 [Candelaria pacifica]